MIQQQIVQNRNREEDYLFFFLKARPINAPIVAKIIIHETIERECNTTTFSVIPPMINNGNEYIPNIPYWKSEFPVAYPIGIISDDNIIPTIAPIHNPRNQCLAISLLKKRYYINLSILNKSSETNRENPKLCLSATFPTEKEFNMRYQENSNEFSQMPNGTSDNPNIKLNKNFHLK